MSDATEPSDKPIPDNWLSSTEASRASKIHIRTLQRMVQRGEIEGRRDSNGALWFNPDELEGAKRGEGVAEILTAAVALLRQSHGHNEELLEPVVQLLAVFKSDKDTDRARINSLEGRVQSMHEASERALSQQQERMLAREKHDAEQRRLDKALDFLMSFQPLVNAMVAKHFGFPETGEAIGIAEFVASFSADEISGMVSGLPQEKALVVLGIYDQAVERKKKREAAAAAAKAPADTSSNGSSSSSTEAKTT